ncbi:MAG: VacJ family lipoprotein [Gammaproteobacteria bacterium]|nr:VacJ family lipoprotein [Gammaproteobacteria bacterium]
MSSRFPGLLLALFIALGAAGCASQAATAKAPPDPDPLEPVNRAIYSANEVLDYFVARPVARGYEKLTPQFFRTGAGNFFRNLGYPVTILNDFLQGKFRQGGADTLRFAMNTTVGLAGLLDPATEMGLEVHDEDFGQTLAVWGLPEGPYLVMPVFGPTTLLAGAGDLADTQASLLYQWPGSNGSRNALVAWELTHRRYTLLPYDEQVEQAFDRYAFVRDAYLQNRRYKIHDGQLPVDDLFPDDFEDDYED